MDDRTADIIRNEIECIEQGSGFGSVEVVIQNGKVHHIKPTSCIMLKGIDTTVPV